MALVRVGNGCVHVGMSGWVWMCVLVIVCVYVPVYMHVCGEQ